MSQREITAPALFDTALVRRRLARAWSDPVEGADVLLARAAEDAAERLSAVLRPFPVAIDLGSPLPLLASWPAAQATPRMVRWLAPFPATEAAAVADPGLVPLAPESVDLVVSLYGLQAVDDLPGALAQVACALRPDGLFLGCLAGGETLHELRQVLAEAESDCTGGVSPRVAPMADLRDLGTLLQRAGLALPVTDVERVTLRYGSFIALLRDLRAMGATNPLLARLRRPTGRSVFARAAALYAQRFADGDGRLRATVETVWLSGWKPHVSQQQPLRPGSAQRRLADVLGPIRTAAGADANADDVRRGRSP